MMQLRTLCLAASFVLTASFMAPATATAGALGVPHVIKDSGVQQPVEVHKRKYRKRYHRRNRVVRYCAAYPWRCRPYHARRSCYYNSWGELRCGRRHYGLRGPFLYGWGFGFSL